MKKYIILSFIAVILLAACSEKHYDLNQSVFVEDPLNPGLPVYSAQGNNTFGAYINNVAFVSSQNTAPAEVVTFNDTLVINMKGLFENETATMEFLFASPVPGSDITSYQDLIILKNKEFDLASSGCVVTFSVNGQKEEIHIQRGTFIIKDAQKIFIDMDEEPAKIVLAGEFRFTQDNELMIISNGRFDLSIGDDNFYNSDE